MNWLFVLTVVLPVGLSVLYFGGLASDVYVSESHVVVRGSQRQPQIGAGLSALLQGGGITRSAEDSAAVIDFMTSRDALRRLDEELHLKQAFSSPQVDLLNRFAALDGDDSFEALYRYYRNRVSVTADPLTQIVVLTVRAFDAETAYRMNERLLEMSEDLVNRLNERSRHDTLQTAEAVVAAIEERARAVSVAVSEYRHRQAVFDPAQQSSLQLQQVAALQTQLSATKTRLAQIRTLAKDNPQIQPLQRMVEATQAEIDTQNSKVTGDQLSLAVKTVEYESLVFEQTLVAKQLEAALVSLEQAREDVRRKHLYLERIVQPSRPDVALEPTRLRSVLVTVLLGLIAWGVLSLLVAGVREHHD